jgi:Fe-S-cluster containining protein
MRIVPYPLAFGSMSECDNCGLCCGPVGITYEEYGVIKNYCEANGIEWEDCDLLSCGFLDKDNHCRIYEVRPYLCRAYGITVELPCPRYPNAARISLPPEEALRQGLTTYEGVLLESVKGVTADART